MTDEQFDALAALTRLHARSAAPREGARLVLVDGMAPSDAAARAGVSRQSVSNVLARCRKTLDLVRKVTEK
jgi:predicted DNA-binding protein (UPF0251 family)